MKKFFIVALLFAFVLNLPAKPGNIALKPEEARWEVTKEYARLYGDSTPTGSSRIILGVEDRGGMGGIWQPVLLAVE